MRPSLFAPERAATAADVVTRLAGYDYEWTAIHALGGGMGPAQLRHPQAVAAAEAVGLVVTAVRRGVPVVQLNRTAAAEAHAAVTAIDTDPGTRILSAQIVEGRLIVVMRNDAWDMPLAVDTFRRPTTAETDPELADWARVALDAWLLVEQAAAGDMGEVVDLVREAREAALDEAAHTAASHVRQRPVALDDKEREDLSKKLSEINKRSSGK
ncbi:hypothetical protein ACFVFF_23190 [Streptomyces sp. NPDC057680]|uniref:hypothetical protein n=1 Tax=Streptomyces sp. NPDC057680 TaxID=3346208 RepID=UPI0036B41D12